MIIGVDISALQGPHRMRGIGYTVLNFISNISKEDREKHKFILFLLKDGDIDGVLSSLDLQNLNYEVRYINNALLQNTGQPPPGRLARLLKSVKGQSIELRERYFGSSAYGDIGDIDYFIQPDQSRTLPKGRRLKKALILYDIIPYVLEWEYLWSYKTARLRGLPVLSSLRCSARRWVYLKKLMVNIGRADILIAISEATKSDFIKYVKAPEEKIKVIHLGVAPGEKVTSNKILYRYFTTPWGYMKRSFKYDFTKPFILYVGGADPRRRLDDLVAAYNNLRAEGHDISLVVTGDTMQGPDAIPTPMINKAMKDSSYLDDIIFMGFVTDEVREMLYQETLVFVYPSKYEGFGLPILEAMNRGTPVITYRNSSIPEVGGNSVLYAHNYIDIADYINELIHDPKLRKTYIDLGLKQASKFSWQTVSKNIILAIQ